jgi:hypothetical protein
MILFGVLFRTGLTVVWIFEFSMLLLMNWVVLFVGFGDFEGSLLRGTCGQVWFGMQSISFDGRKSDTV